MRGRSAQLTLRRGIRLERLESLERLQRRTATGTRRRRRGSRTRIRLDVAVTEKTGCSQEKNQVKHHQDNVPGLRRTSTEATLGRG